MKAQGEAIMTIGFDQPLYILPFDQRESFQTKMWRQTSGSNYFDFQAAIFTGDRTSWLESALPRTSS
jgi:hypothetical protein